MSANTFNAMIQQLRKYRETGHRTHVGRAEVRFTDSGIRQASLTVVSMTQITETNLTEQSRKCEQMG